MINMRYPTGAHRPHWSNGEMLARKPISPPTTCQTCGNVITWLNIVDCVAFMDYTCTAWALLVWTRLVRKLWWLCCFRIEQPMQWSCYTKAIAYAYLFIGIEMVVPRSETSVVWWPADTDTSWIIFHRIFCMAISEVMTLRHSCWQAPSITYCATSFFIDISFIYSTLPKCGHASTAGVMLSFKIPILETRVRFPGSAPFTPLYPPLNHNTSKLPCFLCSKLL